MSNIFKFPDNLYINNTRPITNVSVGVAQSSTTEVIPPVVENNNGVLTFDITVPQGVRGSQGITGSQGKIGSQGVTGSQGKTGSQGATGSTGTIGVQGSQGVKGSQGVTGSQGVPGPFLSSAITNSWAVSSGNLVFYI